MAQPLTRLCDPANEGERRDCAESVVVEPRVQGCPRSLAPIELIEVVERAPGIPRDEPQLPAAVGAEVDAKRCRQKRRANPCLWSEARPIWEGRRCPRGWLDLHELRTLIVRTRCELKPLLRLLARIECSWNPSPSLCINVGCLEAGLTVVGAASRTCAVPLWPLSRTQL
jgi:hypothetical protein